MPTLSDCIIYLVLDFFVQNNLVEAQHWLEQESGLYFNIKYFLELVKIGSWTKAQKYLSAFTSADDNFASRKLFFELGKQKYIEALNRHDYAGTHANLFHEFKPLITFRPEFTQIEDLSKLKNFREDERYRNFDGVNARERLVAEIKKLVDMNPLLWEEHNPGSASRVASIFDQARNVALRQAQILAQSLVLHQAQNRGSYQAQNMEEHNPGSASRVASIFDQARNAALRQAQISAQSLVLHQAQNRGSYQAQNMHPLFGRNPGLASPVGNVSREAINMPPWFRPTPVRQDMQRARIYEHEPEDADVSAASSSKGRQANRGTCRS